MNEIPTLSGKQVSLVPYIRGLSHRETLLRWWLLMDRAKAQDKIFWSQTVHSEEQRGDPIAFIEAFSQRVAFGVYDNQSKNLIGFNWLEHIKPNQHAQYGMFFKRKAWGDKAREATELITTYAFGMVKLKTLWGFTPFMLAVRHGQKIGWKHVATLPGFAWIKNNPKDLYVMKISTLEN